MRVMCILGIHTEKQNKKTKQKQKQNLVVQKSPPCVMAKSNEGHIPLFNFLGCNPSFYKLMPGWFIL